MIKCSLIGILLILSIHLRAQTQFDSIYIKKILKLNGKRVSMISTDTVLAHADTNALITDYAAKALIKPETDPVYTSSGWYSTANNSANWNTAYSWGDWHSSVAPKWDSAIAKSYIAANYQGKGNYLLPSSLSATAPISYSSATGQISWIGTKVDVGLSNVQNVDQTNPANIIQSSTYRFVSDAEKSTWNGKQNALGYTPENASNKGAANGYTPLDGSSKIPTSYLPAITMNNVWVPTSQAEMLALSSAVVGDVAVRTDSSVTYILRYADYTNAANWVRLPQATAPVQSVNGQTGSVNLTTNNISESGNLYYTDGRARAAISVSGSLAYNNNTGVISYTQPTNVSSFSNDAGYITGAYTGFDTRYRSASWVPSWTDINSRPTALSQFTNDLGNYGGFLTSYTETDPTIYAWAKAATKPSYTYTEVGAQPAFTNGTGFLKNNGTGIWSYDNNTYLTTAAAASTYQPLENQRLSTTNTPSFSSLLLTNGLVLNNNTYPTINFKSSSDNISRFLYNGGGANLVWRYDGTNDAIILNTYNYNSYALPLSGGTLTGALNGTSASFSTDVSSQTQFNAGNTGYVAQLLGGSANNYVAVNVNNNTTKWAIGSNAGINNVSQNRNLNFNYFDSTSWHNYFYITPTGAATFTSSVTATAFYNSSDARLKNIISRKGDMVTYRWKDGRDKLIHYGYIAQEVRKTMPNQVLKDDKGYLSVNYTEVHIKKINDLENELAELKQQINELKKLLKALQK